MLTRSNDEADLLSGSDDYFDVELPAGQWIRDQEDRHRLFTQSGWRTNPAAARCDTIELLRERLHYSCLAPGGAGNDQRTI